MGYSRGTSNYPEKIVLFDPTHMMSMVDPAAIGVETLRIDSGCSLRKEFIELIHMMDIMWPISQSHFHVSCLCSLK